MMIQDLNRNISDFKKHKFYISSNGIQSPIVKNIQSVFPIAGKLVQTYNQKIGHGLQLLYINIS
ncbi:Uncharacterised protein [Actinobacillus equuli]|nr:Uncharacterised protein [Actinobacillus equuli]